MCAPGEIFPDGLMWDPEEYYNADGPVFRAARGGSLAGAGPGPSGRAGTAVPASLVGALPDAGAVECRDAVLRVECSLEGLVLAARAIMHAPISRAALPRLKRASSGKGVAKSRGGAAKAGAGARAALPGGAARALVFQVLCTLRVMGRLQEAVRCAVGGSHTVDMSSSSSLGAQLPAHLQFFVGVRNRIAGGQLPSRTMDMHFPGRRGLEPLRPPPIPLCCLAPSGGMTRWCSHVRAVKTVSQWLIQLLGRASEALLVIHTCAAI